MSTAVLIVVIVVAVLIVAAIVAWLVRTQLRRRHLREQFGPEYERTVERQTDRGAAERELAEREKRHERIELHPLSPTSRDSYTRNWNRIQERFVDVPTSAVGEADRLLTELMAELGYPTRGYEQQLTDLSVEHARTIEHYRAAHAISMRNDRGEASTEDLRQAMVHDRALFEDLIDSGSGRRGTP